MNSSPPKRTAKHLLASDLRGIAQLGSQATAGIARIVEGVHQSIWDRLGVPGGHAPGQTRGITGLAYRSVHGVNRLVGDGLQALLKRLEPLLAADAQTQQASPQRAALLAALNGVMGDHLLASNNPLAIPMSMRWQDHTLDWQDLPPDFAPSGKVLLLIHGLCMNDLQWQASHKGQPVDHGQSLAAALGYCPIYLRYNSGLHTSQNGRELAAQLELLVRHWPVPVEEISIVAHSMGGLLTRSACHFATEQTSHWLPLLKNIVFLGTPHHGAPLERAGNWIDVLLGSTPYTAPLAKLGQLRSAGITDLRHGHVRDEDWMGDNRFHRLPDQRLITPLPAGVNCFAVAATMAAKRGALANRLIGDGLVPLHSALGEHSDPRRDLGFAKSEQLICYRMNHMELLSSPMLTQQMQDWLKPAKPSKAVKS
ncbi:esterase/lipase family protein [Roseateles oligotrophus]|uniref:GPI inositol-deacylase n=1 Tax=Roseateles oligotrophus TaxID=1769250 RepID=A0ABT2YJF8_9BURK|nr:GPI inositol-deacylase [Roseateles oligotrophus]MCV2370185.1 GPI inositol-deacylase [Roseateles oligotrophus]